MTKYTSFDGEKQNKVTFEQFLRFKNYKQKSIDAHCHKMEKLPEFSKEAIFDYITLILQTHTTSTVNKYLNTYRLYGKYLVTTNQATKEELDWLKDFKHYKEVPRQRVVFADKEIQAFLSEDDRYSVYFKLLAHTGARPSELASLEKRDIDFANNTISIQQSKTGDGRTIPIPESIVDDLYDYLHSNSSKWAFPIFCHDERHITIESIRKAFKKRRESTGINPELTPYCFRHTFITRMLASGADLFVVQSIVGHKRANTTQGYMHTNLLMQKQVMKKDPLVWRFLPPKEKLKMVFEFIANLGLDLDEKFEFISSSNQLVLRIV